MLTDRKKPRYQFYQQLRFPLGFPLENIQSGINYQAQPQDVFIVTYPKGGTTWTQHIIWMLKSAGEPLPIGKDINLEIPHLEDVGGEFVSALSPPRFIKTHLECSLVSYHQEAKYIYVVRNPFDCAVSFYYHTQGFIRHYDFLDGTFDDFFECFIAGEVDFGDYFDHLLSWYQYKDKANVLLMTYEAMKANPQQAIIKIATFLGGQYLELVNNAEILNKIIYHTSFAQMSKNQSRWTSSRSNQVTPFIRKGKVGDWQNHFSAEQVERLTEKFRLKTAGTDLNKLWLNIIP